MTVTNLVRDGRRDHRPADPPVGPSVDDLAAALADLAPFKVTSPPRDVTAFGYRGKHLELTVPDLSHAGKGLESGFTECIDGNLESWDRTHNRRVLWLRGPRLHRGFLDSRRRKHPSGDHGGTNPWLAPERPRRAARHPGLHTDRAITFMVRRGSTVRVRQRASHERFWRYVMAGRAGRTCDGYSPSQ
jgi:hypothetical protein